MRQIWLGIDLPRHIFVEGPALGGLPGGAAPPPFPPAGADRPAQPASPMRAHLLLLAAALGLAGCVSDRYQLEAPEPRARMLFRASDLGQGQDPSVVFHDGLYYYVQSGQNTITVRAAPSLKTLAAATAVAVWRGNQEGTPCCELWAPELVTLGGKWYIYFAADDGRNENHRMYAIEADAPGGPYRFKGKLETPGGDRWAIDGAAFEAPDGRLYFVWSGWEGEVNVAQHLYIARLANPWTIEGPRVRLSTPERPWETSGAPPAVNEGPQPLVRGGKVWLAYSASGCWTPDYKLGLLVAEAGADLLTPESWTKYDEPVFEPDPEAGIYGAGHNNFFRSPDGAEDWLIYHATANPQGNCGAERTVRAHPIRWRADGTPDFGRPLPPDQDLPLPSGDPGP